MHQFDLIPISLPHPSAAQNLDIVDNAITGFLPGDFLYYDESVGYVKSANALTWDTDKITTQKAFAKKFVGRSSVNVASGNISGTKHHVQTGGLHELVVSSGTYHPGDLLGLAKQSGGNALYGQTLEAVTDPDAAVAVVVMPSGASATTCVARLLPNQLLSHDNIVADCTMTKDTEGTTAANTIRVTGTLKDRWGRTLGGIRTVPFQLAVTATTGDAITGTSPNGAVAIGTLGVARFSLAKRAGWITTDANGQFNLDITDSGTPTFYLLILAGARVAASPAITFA